MPLYGELLAKGIRKAETELFNGEYFFQKHRMEKSARRKTPWRIKAWSEVTPPRRCRSLKRKGRSINTATVAWPTVCWAPGWPWFAEWATCSTATRSPAISIPFSSTISRKTSPSHRQPAAAHLRLGAEGGLLLCTWPKGGQPSLPFVYSNEVWTGIEYQVASHLMLPRVWLQEGLDVVRTCRARYDGRVRNPFDEYECGHWYARAMSSYALLFGLTGARFDAIEKILYLEPSIHGDFHSFFAAASGYGTVGVRAGKPFYEPKHGTLEINELKYAPPA